jgi:tetratricopeptide (TPR) repeat protein
VDTAAYDAYLRGMYYLDQINPTSLVKAKQYFNRAIEIDPDWAPPYSGLAEAWEYQQQMGFETTFAANPKIYENMYKALELDPNSSTSLYRKGQVAAWTEWNWEKSEQAFLKAIDLDPNNALGRISYSHVLIILRRTDEALEQGRIACELDPKRPFILALNATMLVYAGECETALTYAQTAFSIDPDHYFAFTTLWGAYDCLGEYEKAFPMWKKFNIKFWEKHGLTERYEKIFRDQGWIAVMKEAIRFLEEDLVKERPMEPGEVFSLGDKHMTVGNYEKAVDCYEKVSETHDPNLPYISTPRYYNKLKTDPRYLSLLKKMNLPVD